MKLKSNHGLTLVEALVASTLFLISTTAYLSLFYFYQKNRAGIDSTQIMKALLLQNVIEIKGNALKDLPAKNRCVVRIYDRNKTLLSNLQTSASGGVCPRTPPSAGKIVIQWDVLGAEHIEITFVPNKGLKLPQYTDTIRQFNLTGEYKSGEEAVDSIALTIFKR